MKTQVITIMAASLTTLAIAGQWPQYHGANSDRTTAEKITNTDWKSTAPKKLWKANTPTGFSSFIVAGGNAYTVIQEEIDGIPSEVCIAFDAEEGTTQWKANLDMWRVSNGGGNAGAPDNKGGDGPRSTPAYADGHVYCYTSDIRLVCLSAEDGAEIWAVEVAKEYGGKNIRWENASAPVIEENLVIVQGGGPEQSFLAFDKKKGALKWKSGSYTMTHATPVATTINNQRQILFFCQEGMVSVDPEDGSELWVHKFPFKVSTAASAVIEGNIVYFAAGYGVGATAIRVAKDNSTTQLWFSEGNKPVTNHWSTPLAKDGHLYGMFGFKEYANGPLKCIELATGKVKWEQPGYGPGGVCLAGDTLVCLGDAGQVTLVKATPESYQELARMDDAVRGKCWSAPVLSGGKIFIRSTVEAACLDVR